jgi:UDP-N-acetylglucosamine--N-acetylmuramyl-(pentapeptide) pyrophosphoryl-undecaprenol N-acetylglucosamine transferase
MKVLFSGGGTVGHLAPAFALLPALEARGVGHVFATPGEPVEAAWFPPGAPRVTLRAPRLRQDPRSLAAFPGRLLRAALSARQLLRREGAGVVVGLGGWPCVPAVLAAASAGTPVALLASDERAGLAVRGLSALAERVYVAREEAARDLPAPRVVVTGPLIRPGIRSGRRAPEAFGLSRERRTLFVTGGSLGARRLNEAVVQGLRAAVRDDPGLSSRVQVLHQTGEGAGDVAGAYRALGLVHHVAPFVRDMGTAWATADLALCRAGAVTCAELEATGTPAVLVPYPHHGDRQQVRNAERLVARGGARLLEEERLSDAEIAAVLQLLGSGERLARMSSSLRLDAPDAAARVADDLVRLLQRD